jgi:regulatory protein YycH of two-component signal transduction system YycFG
MELSIFLHNNIVKKYTIDDVLVMEQYPGRNNRWDETAIIFKDSSILWEGGCFTTYVNDGKEFITYNRVNTGGGNYMEKSVKITSIENYHKFVEKIKDKLTLVNCEGTFQDKDYYFLWKNTSS